ncbi:hypothetical protein RB595_003511 [Gaeumannomyces hyphopodioides]
MSEDLGASGPEAQSDRAGLFRKIWPVATNDSNLTLHGFRRFKTSHLLNLRFLEEEIAELDHRIYQAGLSLQIEPSDADRLGLKHCKRDAQVPDPAEVIRRETVEALRNLLKQYDDALISFNQIMSMETFSLIDDEKQAILRTDLTLEEVYKTRLLRADLPPRSRTDPFQRQFHKMLRALRYRKISGRAAGSQEVRQPLGHPGGTWTQQNTALIAGILGRVATTVVIAVFLVAPMAALVFVEDRAKQLVISCVFILAFSFLVALTLQISNFEMMAVSAAYAAVLSTFMS